MCRYGILMVFLLSVTANAEIYKWVDENGKVHFTDKKPESTKVEELNYKTKDIQTEEETLRRLREMDEYSESYLETQQQQAKEDQDQEREARKNRIKCNKLEMLIKEYQSASYIYDRNEDGSRKILDKSEREKTQKRMEKDYARLCK